MSCTEDWLAVFKVKDTEKVQHFIEFQLRFFSVPLISVQPDWVYCCCVTKYQTKCGQTGPVIILITTL